MSIDKQVAEINRLTKSVRAHINTHRYQSALLDDSKKWNQICSSLDVIGDSLEAIQSYEQENYPNAIGLRYLFTYGLLQAFFLMQDALRHLSEAFEIPFKLTDTLREIRNFRNASIGHPTKQDQNGKRCYNYISRISMSKSGFDLMRSTGDRDHAFLHVDLMKACADQLNGVIAAYGKVAEALEEIDRVHRDKFKDSQLTDIFHSAMDYCFEKISQGIQGHSHGDREFGHRHVGMVKKTYEKFRTAMSERGDLNEYTEFDLSEYFHALEKLDKFFSAEDETMGEVDARIYLSYLRHEHRHFVAVAGEVDAEYQTKT